MHIHRKLTMRVLTLLLVVFGVVGAAVWSPEVRAQDDEDDPVLIEIAGTVEVLSEDTLVISGVTVAPSGAFNPSTLEVGDEVIVTGYLLNDDTLKAIGLVFADAGEDEDAGDTDDGDTGDDEDVDYTSCVGAEPHPVGLALSVEFDVEYGTIMEWHCDGVGLGEIARALLIAQQAGAAGDTDAADILAQREDGAGWGTIKDDYGVSPSDLAPGRIISAQKKDMIEPEQAQEQVEQQAGPPGQQDNDHPQGGPPGQQNNDQPQGDPPGQQNQEESGGGPPAGGPPGQDGKDHPQGGPPGQNKGGGKK
jgi:hypothetical protein